MQSQAEWFFLLIMCLIWAYALWTFIGPVSCITTLGLLFLYCVNRSYVPTELSMLSVLIGSLARASEYM